MNMKDCTELMLPLNSVQSVEIYSVTDPKS
jgi:hypothetical protein